MEFLFEKLEVYQRSMALVAFVDAVLESLKGKFPSPRIDQFSRASLSIPLNIAEETDAAVRMSGRIFSLSLVAQHLNVPRSLSC